MIIRYKKAKHIGEHRSISITEITITVAKQADRLLKIQVENQCYCMAIMQMVVVACLGTKDAPGRGAVKLQKDSPEKIISRRGLIRARA